jgi:ribose-phosphate pyrophosphokinase
MKDAYDRIEPGIKVRLLLSYMPYARQDRVCNRGEAFSLGVVAKLINSAGFEQVFIEDPHSDVTPALINNCVVISQEVLFQQYYNESKGKIFLDYCSNALLVSPDAGANKKTQLIAKYLRASEFVRADKIRNLQTGEIMHTQVYGRVQGRDCLIVDDICDGGATFIALAKALKFIDAKRVGLFVTHGIFSKGKQHLLDNGIDDIFVVNDWTKTEEE